MTPPPNEEVAMADALVRSESPMEFFREQLQKAMEHQRVSTSDFTQYYLVHLLAESVRERLPAPAPGLDETPLALLYVRALHAARAERVRLLKTMGDSALFVSGFFQDSLEGRLVDADYYRALGGSAYARLSREHDPLSGFGSEVYSELAARFGEFADLLAEIAQSAHLTASNASLVKLYERWLATRSRRAAVLLAERGIVPLDPGEMVTQ